MHESFDSGEISSANESFNSEEIYEVHESLIQKRFLKWMELFDKEEISGVNRQFSDSEHDFSERVIVFLTI